MTSIGKQMFRLGTANLTCYEYFFPILDRNTFGFILGDGRRYFMDVA